MEEKSFVIPNNQYHDETDQLEVIVYQVGDVLFAIRILKLREIIRPMEATASPNRHAFVDGVIQLRDAFIPVINLANVLDIKDSTTDKEDKLMILDIDQTTVAFHVHKVTNIYHLKWSDIERSNHLSKGMDRNVSGIIRLDGRIVFMLDEKKIVSAIGQK